MIHILTIVYGDHHINLFKNACLKSLAMKKNKEALETTDVHWHVYTDLASVDKVNLWIKEALPNIILHIKDVSDTRRYIDASQSAFIMVAEECLKDNAQMLFAPPDIFFGDGSINGLLKSIADKNSIAPVAVVAHARVTPEMLDDIKLKNENISNAELVSLTWKYLHRCWEDAELGHPRQNQWGTGVAWRKIDDNLYGVTHRLPTPYLINLTKEDVDYFKFQGGFGYFDHRWPGDILIPQGRQRYVSSSDIAFMAEITEPIKNISNVVPGGKPNPDDFWQHNPHNEVNKQLLITFRGE